MENKLKHLEFIQTTINRMGHNSFLIKAWSVTLVSGVFVLSAKDLNKEYLLFAFFPTLFFWFLDSYFLYQERIFRDHYDYVRKNDHTKIDFSMKPENISEDSTFRKSFFSFTEILYYLGIFVTLLIVFLIL